MFYWILYVIFWLPLRILYPTKVIGKKNLPKDNFVGSCNHYSNFDVILLGNRVRRFYYLAKKELFKTKSSNWFFRMMGAYPVDRESADLSAIKFALGTLKNNKSLMIFPEGTRNKTDDLEHLQQLKQGAIMFASKSGKKIVPMLIEKPERVFRRNRIIIGEPLEIVGENPQRLTKEEMEENATRLLGAMNQLREELNKTKK